MTQEQKNVLLRFRNFVYFRNKISLLLSLVILVLYYVFVFGIGMAPEVLGSRIGTSSVSLGIIYGIFIIVSCIIVTGLYTFVANQYMDKDQDEILSDIEKSGLMEDLKNGKITYKIQE